jgi:hypothetical protein
MYTHTHTHTHTQAASQCNRLQEPVAPACMYVFLCVCVCACVRVCVCACVHIYIQRLARIATSRSYATLHGWRMRSACGAYAKVGANERLAHGHQPLPHSHQDGIHEKPTLEVYLYYLCVRVCGGECGAYAVRMRCVCGAYAVRMICIRSVGDTAF